MPPKKKKQVSKKRQENPYGKGKPVDEKVVLEGMKVYEKELDAEFDELHQQFMERYMLEEKARDKLLAGFKKMGIDFTEEMEQMKQKASKFESGAASPGRPSKFLEKSSPLGARF
jgi:hypothetical protein